MQYQCISTFITRDGTVEGIDVGLTTNCEMTIWQHNKTMYQIRIFPMGKTSQ
jgi:phosphoribosylformimino-5-aminoimidazole carboxamide ribonucleotide (ProFAR) isomerase